MPKEIKKKVYTFAELKERAEKDKKNKSKQAAVEKASQQLREWATEDEWYDSVYEQWQSALDQIGFTDAKINFSGFWSQGDGASFTAKVDLERLVDFLASNIQPKDGVDLAKPPIHGHDEDFRGWIVKQVNGVRNNPKYRHLLLVPDAIEDLHVERIDNHYCHYNTCRLRGELRDNGDGHTDEKGKWQWKSRQPRLRKLFDEFMVDAEQLREDLSKAIYKYLEEEYNGLTSDESIADFAAGNDYYFTASGGFEGSFDEEEGDDVEE